MLTVILSDERLTVCPSSSGFICLPNFLSGVSITLKLSCRGACVRLAGYFCTRTMVGEKNVTSVVCSVCGSLTRTEFSALMAEKGMSATIVRNSSCFIFIRILIFLPAKVARLPDNLATQMLI